MGYRKQVNSTLRWHFNIRNS